MDSMGGPLLVGQLRQRALAGEDEDQVVRVDALEARRVGERRASRRSAPSGRRGSRSTRACSARRTGGPSTSIRPTSRHSSVTPSNGDAAAPGAARRRRRSARQPWPRAFVAVFFARQEVERHAAQSSVLPAVLADRLDDGRVGEGRRVAERPALGDVAQQPAHDLAASGSSAGPGVNIRAFGLAIGLIFVATWLAQLLAELRRSARCRGAGSRRR